MKIIKIVLSALFILGGIRIIMQGSITSGVLSIALGVLLIPQIGEKLKNSVNVWKKKSVRLVTYVILLLLSGVTNKSTAESSFRENFVSKQNNKAPLGYIQSYNDKTEFNIANLSDERKKLRSDMVAKIKQTKTYNELVDNKIVSAEYLPILTLVNNGVRAIVVNNEGKESVLFNSNLINNLKQYDGSKDKEIFATNTAILATSNKGGFTKELLDVFIRYKNKYGLFAKASKSYDVNGDLAESRLPYNLSAIFYHIHPNSKNYEAIYEANKAGISSWFGTARTYQFTNKYFAYKQDYLTYAKKNYPDNPYTLKVDYEISAKELYTAYEQNEISADNKYKGKKLAVTGVIKDIGNDILNDSYITLKTDNLFGSVQCFLNKKDVAKLSKGAKVTIIGKCTGLFGTVGLKNCKLVQ